MLTFFLALIFIPGVSPVSSAAEIKTENTIVTVVSTSTVIIKNIQEVNNDEESIIPNVPFYSQFKDITSSKWKKVGCGIASLAMLIDYYEPAVSVDVLLKQGIDSNAYLDSAGWTYKGLIDISEKYGLEGNSYDLAKQSSEDAFDELKDSLKSGPVMASIHYKFDPKNPIPHLVVINGIEDDVMYYNDPAEKSGGGQVSTDKFLKAWKKRFIVIRPA